MEWIDALNEVLRNVEAHLEDGTDAGAIAQTSGYSPFYLQRIFSMLTETTLGEYMRERRLSEAGVRLRNGESVLDVSLRYGWDSPESFNRAFRKFHGVAPSAARSERTQLKYVTPLRLTIQLTGGNAMKYTIEKRDALKIIGMERIFSGDTSFSEIPGFWDEYEEKGLHAVVPGCLGVCFDDAGDGSVAYMIAGCYQEGMEVPEGFTVRTLPEQLCANFECSGQLPGCIQALNRRIYADWLPSNGRYALANEICVEWYGTPDPQTGEARCGIIIPVREIE